MDTIDRHYEKHEFERSVLEALKSPLFVEVRSRVQQRKAKNGVP